LHRLLRQFLPRTDACRPDLNFLGRFYIRYQAGGRGFFCSGLGKFEVADAYRELPKSWFNDFVDRALQRFGKVYII
jgi:hypothetical protein